MNINYNYNEKNLTFKSYDFINKTDEWKNFLNEIGYTNEFIQAFECPYNKLYNDLPHIHSAIIGGTQKNYKIFEYYLNREWVGYLQNILPNYDYESFSKPKKNEYNEYHQQGIYLNSNDEKKFRLNYLVSTPKLYAGFNTDTNFDKSKICSQFKRAIGTEKEQQGYLNYLHIIDKYNIKALKFSNNFEKVYKIGSYRKYENTDNTKYAKILENKKERARQTAKKSYFKATYRPNGMKNDEFEVYYQWSLSHKYRGEMVDKNELYADYKREKEEFIKKYPKNQRKMAHKEWKELFSAQNLLKSL